MGRARHVPMLTIRPATLPVSHPGPVLGPGPTAYHVGVLTEHTSGTHTGPHIEGVGGTGTKGSSMDSLTPAHSARGWA